MGIPALGVQPLCSWLDIKKGDITLDDLMEMHLVLDEISAMAEKRALEAESRKGV